MKKQDCYEENYAFLAQYWKTKITMNIYVIVIY